MPEDLLKTVANRTNQAILNALAVEASYPRKMAELLSFPETAVSRRLKRMEELGLVVGEWSRIGKSVKLYRLVSDSVLLRFTRDGLRLDVSMREGGGARTAVLRPVASRIPEPEVFVGRKRELKLLAEKGPVLLVEGLPGIGKTSLLAQYAHAESARRPVLWHSFRGPESLRWLASHVAGFGGCAGAQPLREALEAGAEDSELHKRLLSALDDASCAFVFDDSHRAEDPAVRALLSDAMDTVHRGKLVLSARERPRRDPSRGHVTVLQLEGLSDEEMQRFVEGKGLEVDGTLLPRLREEVGGHPLALNLLIEAVRVSGEKLERFLDRIPEKDLQEYLLAEIDEHLTEGQRAVLTAASVFRGPFTLEDLKALSPRDPEPVLFHLRRRLLVADHGDGFVLHETVRNFFHNLLAEKPKLHDKAANLFLDRGTVEGRIEAMHHLLAAGRRERVLSLLEEDLDLQEFDVIDLGYQNLYLGVLESFDPKEVRDPRRRALIEDEKGDIRLHQGDAKRALGHYETAKEIFAKEKANDRLADLAWKRSLAFERLKDAKGARAAVEEGLAVAKKGSREKKRLEEVRRRIKGA